MSTSAPGNDEPTAANGGPSDNTSREGDTMKMQWRMQRAKSVPGGGATCEFVAENGQTAVVTIRGLRSTRALAHLGAMQRVLNGAIVLDGADLMAIHTHIEDARGLASRLAPEGDGSTILLESIERARGQMAGVLPS